MGYVAVKAGEELIERAAELFERQRVAGESPPTSVDQLEGQLGRLVARATGEGGVYAPRLAAVAVKQAQGDAVEAAFLLRAYRSTLERFGAGETVEAGDVAVTRRVSPAYKDVPGGQILGATRDYTRRLLDLSLVAEGPDDDDATPRDPTADWERDPDRDPDPDGDGDRDVDHDGDREGLTAPSFRDGDPDSVRDVIDLLREEGLVAEPTDGGFDEPADTTREPVTHPAGRDEVLQELARGETGAITALGYSALRGYGQVHPTLAEVRVGRLPVRIEHPYTGGTVTVTDCEVTQCEAVVPAYAGRDDPQFALGYGLTFGRNERKAIAASILDASIRLDGTAEPAEDPEFVLDVIDGMDSFGFIEHLKLPHYVTFQSILDRIRSIRDREGSEGRGGDAGAAEDLEDRGGNAGAAGGGQRSEGRGGEERAAEGDEGRDGDERTEAAGDVGGGADAGMGADADAETDEVDATPEVDDD